MAKDPDYGCLVLEHIACLEESWLKAVLFVLSVCWLLQWSSTVLEKGGLNGLSSCLLPLWPREREEKGHLR